LIKIGRIAFNEEEEEEEEEKNSYPQEYSSLSDFLCK
jgi:hypothetical protein